MWPHLQHLWLQWDALCSSARDSLGLQADRKFVRASFCTLRLPAGTFDLLVYTDAASDVPQEWEDSDPRFIQNAADVKLRSFTTKVSQKTLLYYDASCSCDSLCTPTMTILLLNTSLN